MMVTELLMTHDTPNIDLTELLKQSKVSPESWPQTAQSIKQSIKGALYHLITLNQLISIDPPTESPPTQS